MKTKKKILSMLISMGLILSLTACGEEKSKETTGVKDSTSVESTSSVENETDSSVVETTTTEATTDKPTTTVKVGDYITFGTYEQNNVGAEKIEWKILDIRDGKALIISKYGLDCKPYNEKDKGVTWESCTLRSWLNGVFYNTAFTAEDRLRIIETVIINTDNPNYGTEGGNNTSDKVFLLSIEEVNKYFSYRDERKVTRTEYAEKQGAGGNDNGVSSWWLRTPGGGRANAACVNTNGDVDYNGIWVDSDKFVVCPVLWIDYETIKPEEISQQVTEVPTIKPTVSVEVGDYITFGTYEQNDVDDGKEEIEWKVIDVKEGKALIISKYCLDAKPYNTEHTSLTWENCTLRKWLNEEFYDIAFTAEDKLRISEESVDDTKDKVFLLNIEEVNKYFSNDGDRIATSTVYAVNQCSQVSSDNGGSWWWLRTSSSDSYRVPYVMAYGGVNDYGSDFDGVLNAEGDVVYGRIAVRPALWINLE